MVLGLQAAIWLGAGIALIILLSRRRRRKVTR
jgi:hypothetical protein